MKSWVEHIESQTDHRKMYRVLTGSAPHRHTPKIFNDLVKHCIKSRYKLYIKWPRLKMMPSSVEHSLHLPSSCVTVAYSLCITYSTPLLSTLLTGFSQNPSALSYKIIHKPENLHYCFKILQNYNFSWKLSRIAAENLLYSKWFESRSISS